MAEMDGSHVTGDSSVTIPGVPGRAIHVNWIMGYFRGPGPMTGTLRMKEGNTVVWEAHVSGGINQYFPGYWPRTTGATVTIELTGAYLFVRYYWQV